MRARMLEAFRTRMYFFMGIAVLVFSLLLIQLINLQLVHGKEYRIKSRLNMENCIPISASRGEVYDRNFGQGGTNAVIVSNRPSFNITTVRSKFNDRAHFEKVITSLSSILGIEKKQVLMEIRSRRPWERVVIKEDVSFDTVVKIASHQDRFPNIEWEDAPVRVYNYGSMFAHVVGYIGSISRDEYDRLKGRGYKHYQKIGKSGIEKRYDSLLRGEDGFVRRIVDVKNRTEGEEIGLKPKSGSNIVMTLDYGVQEAAFSAMGDLKGTVVVLKPATGEIIAMVSKPDYDPNLIISKNNTETIRRLSGNKNRPFLNRAIQSKYPPASTFKLVTAIAALETEKSYPSKHYFCPGKYTLKGYRDRDFYCYEAHGSLDLYHAIAKSCSVYFYQLGYKTGPTIILKYADYFGLNSKTGIDVPGEVPGFVPSKRWKLRTFGQQWYDGDTLNLSIGQGFLNVTPIGMANFICGIVNNGIVYRPYLIKEVRSADNSRIERTADKEKIREIPLSPLTLNAVKKGMRLSVTSGTSMRLGYLKVPVAGKTGTAQTRSRRNEDASQHAWFVGYAPYAGPSEKSVAVVVMVEYGIAGAVSAVPIAERVFARMYNSGYFN